MAVTERLTDCRVRVNILSLVTRQQDRIKRILEDGLETSSAQFECFLSAAPVGDVQCQTKSPGKLSVLVRKRGVQPLASQDAAVLGAVLVHAVGVHVQAGNATNYLLQFGG